MVLTQEGLEIFQQLVFVFELLNPLPDPHDLAAFVDLGGAVAGKYRLFRFLMLSCPASERRILDVRLFHKIDSPYLAVWGGLCRPRL